MRSPRLRVIAGPNGSGKSSLIKTLQNKNIELGHYLNPDLLHQKIKKHKKLSLNQFNLSTSNSEFLSSILSSSFPAKVKADFKKGKIKICDNVIVFEADSIGSYSTAIVVEFLREALIKEKVKFTFETVFSHPGKIDCLKRACGSGYKVYLYFVNTTSIDININRIQSRVASGGHDVPIEKIKKRFKRSLANLFPALPYVYRAYFFDNSGKNLNWFAELNPSKKNPSTSEISVYKNQHVPDWFIQNVINQAGKI